MFATCPESLTSIGSYAFRSCTSLEELTLPEGLTSIGDFAFQSCFSLEELTLPESLAELGKYAFDRCDSITLIVHRGSRAEELCREQGLEFIYSDSLD